MVKRSFGHDVVGENPLLERVLSTHEAMTSDQAQVLLMMVYDVSFGIHNHDSPASTNPLNTVAMHEAEDYSRLSGLYRAIERYERQSVATRYNLSLAEYLELPREMINMMTELFIESEQRAQAVEHQVNAGADHERSARESWRHPRQ